MKISNSKKELARIISENGGWCDDFSFSAQDGDDFGVWFYRNKPSKGVGRTWRTTGDCERKISCTGAIQNWHQTTLSRAEYFHLYPAPDADGWIEWGGGNIPVGFCTPVDVKLRGGNVELGQQFTFSDSWNHHGGSLDIIAYRLHKPEKKAISSDDAKLTITVDGVEREITPFPATDGVTTPYFIQPPEGEPCSGCLNCGIFGEDPAIKPTIEQLAADYRNAKDHAERKQQEADAAKADAKAKLKALELAGKSIGLIVSPITEKVTHSNAYYKGDDPYKGDAW
ncbi:MAG: hypothetical protein ACRC7D_22545 [Aeromonas popoffii]|uniref:hypothetical protein n=1 Tax=Aeromonas popoffii TaxID=70856 RepID=UPI003F2D901F